jgi:hypothetical protein
MRTIVKLPAVLSTSVMVQGKLKSTVSLAPVLRTYCFIDVA